MDYRNDKIQLRFTLKDLENRLDNLAVDKNQYKKDRIKILETFSSMSDVSKVLLEERKVGIDEAREMVERARIEGPKTADSDRKLRMQGTHCIFTFFRNYYTS
jgi:hypothetical protein